MITGIPIDVVSYNNTICKIDMGNPRRFVAQNPELLLRDGIALFVSIVSQDEIGVRQLLREYETSYPAGYGKHVTTKTVMLLNDKQKNWLRELY